MITGQFTVTASDNGSLVVGESYPLSIDDSAVDVIINSTTTVSVEAIPSAEPTEVPTVATPGGNVPVSADEPAAPTAPATA